MRRFTRLTNGFSKKAGDLKAATALHFAHYNFVRIHQTLRIIPAMAAALTAQVWTPGDFNGRSLTAKNGYVSRSGKLGHY